MLLASSGWVCPEGHGKIQPVKYGDDKIIGRDIVHVGDPYGECPTCKGKGVLACEECDGDGYTTCDHCGSTIDCEECDGDGHLPCEDCEGTGQLTEIKSTTA